MPDLRPELPPDTSGPGRSGTPGFDAFYAASAPALVRQPHAMTGDLGEAQDCVQEGFARARQRWDRVGRCEAPEAWVRQVARRLAVSRFALDAVAAQLARVVP